MDKRKRMRGIVRRALAMLFALAILLGPIGPAVLTPFSRAGAENSPSTYKMQLFCWSKESLESLRDSGQTKRVLLKFDGNRLFNPSTRKSADAYNESAGELYCDGRTYDYTETDKFWGKDGFLSTSDFYAPTMWKQAGGLGIRLSANSSNNGLYRSGSDLYLRSWSDTWTLSGSGSNLRLKQGDEYYLILNSEDNEEPDSVIFVSKQTDRGKPFDSPSYTGVEYQVDVIYNNFTVQNGQITTLGKTGVTYISPYATLTVEDGGILTIAGAILNDGAIHVKDGGLLVLKADTLVIPLDYSSVWRGYISIEGSVIVRSGAVLIGGGYTGLNFGKGATAINFGYMAANSFTVKNPYTIENRKSGTVVEGRAPTHNLHYKLINNVISSEKPAAPSTFITSVSSDFQPDYSMRKLDVATDGVYGEGTETNT